MRVVMRFCSFLIFFVFCFSHLRWAGVSLLTASLHFSPIAENTKKTETEWDSEGDEDSSIKGEGEVGAPSTFLSFMVTATGRRQEKRAREE